MQYVPVGVVAEEDDRFARRRSDDDLETSSDCLLSQLPADGYQIFIGRPASRLPSSTPFVQNLYNRSSSYVSFLTLRETSSSHVLGVISSMARWALRNWSNLFLIFVPIGIMAPRMGCSDTAIFVLNCLAVIPLADILCRATEDVSTYMGETGGALLNVTMGNATEVVILHALIQRQYMIVRTSLLGSIIVNILLVLGLAIFAGEFQLRGQSYNILATRVATCLMGMTTISLLVPSTLKTSPDHVRLESDILDLSRGISIVLIFVYLVYLSTQMNSNKFAYKPILELGPDTPTMDPPSMTQITRLDGIPYTHRRTRSLAREIEEQLAFNSIALQQRPGAISAKFSAALERFKSVPGVRKGLPIAMLLLSTGLISVCGKYLVDSIDHFVDHSMLSKTTIGLIILPIVGNAAELVSAIMFASRKQMDLAFAVSIGSAIQIALFVTPLVVLMGWGFGREMALHFTVFEAVTLIATTVLMGTLVLDERCSSLKGALLVAGYTVIGLGSHFIANPEME